MTVPVMATVTQEKKTALTFSIEQLSNAEFLISDVEGIVEIGDVVFLL